MADDSTQPGPAFDVPQYYGAPRALEMMTSVAAPLLAAGAITLIAAVLQAPESFGSGDAAIAVLLLTVFLLVTSVQCGFMARQHATTPREIADWWITMPIDQRWERVRREQWRAQAAARRWGNSARLSYALGITSLWVGVVLVLIPTGSMGPVRVVAIIGAVVAAVLELTWMLLAARGNLAIAFAKLLRMALPRTVPPPERWKRMQGNDPFAD